MGKGNGLSETPQHSHLLSLVVGVGLVIMTALGIRRYYTAHLIFTLRIGAERRVRTVRICLYGPIRGVKIRWTAHHIPHPYTTTTLQLPLAPCDGDVSCRVG